MSNPHIAPALRRRIVALCLAVVGLLLPGAARGQSNWWTPVEGPYGGTTIWALERMADGSILAGTSNGVHRSLDEGRTWTGYSEGLTTFDVRDILVRADGSVWVGTYGKGLFRRTPGSAAWSAAGLDNIYVTSLAEPQAGVMLAGANGYVHRSTDDGATWAARSLQGYSVNVQSLASNATHIFAATNLGIFRSADTGSTWEFSSFGLQEYDARAIETNAEGHIFAGMQPGQGGCSLYRSRGNGSLWTCVQPQTDPLTVPMLRQAPDGSLWAGGFRHLYSTRDEGGTWLSRRAAGSNVQAVLFLSDGLLIGTHGQGVLRSMDGGISWEDSSFGMQSAITTIRAMEDGPVVAGTQGGLFMTTDLGTTWERVHPDLPLIQHVTDVVRDAQGRLIAATKAGVWRHEGVDGWVAMGPPGMPAIRDLQWSADGTLLAGYYAGVWLFSGSSWVNSSITGPDMASRDVATVFKTSAGSLLAGASWDSWRREAGEATWQLMSSNTLAWFDVQAFGEDGGRIVAGTKFAGVLQSWDDGATWFPLGNGLQGSEDIRDVAFDNRGTVYIATYGSGVYQLNPWTNTWLPVRSGLDGHWRITSMTHDPYGNAWIGTVDGGLFRHGLIGVDVEAAAPLAPAGLELGLPWPNPARDRVQLVLNGSPGPVRIRVVDVTGRTLLTDVRTLGAGPDTWDLDLDRLASGLYLIRVEQGGQSASRRLTVVR